MKKMIILVVLAAIVLLAGSGNEQNDQVLVYGLAADAVQAGNYRNRSLSCGLRSRGLFPATG